MDTNETDSAAQLQRALPCISMETIEELTHRNLLQIGDDYWRFGDDSNGVTRKLNPRQKWMRADNEGAAWHRLIGLDDVVAHDRPYVLLVIEGSKDALAAADFAYYTGLLAETGIVCALGSGYRPIVSELHKLAGRFIGLIGDNDVAGIEATQLVSYALNKAGVEHEVWDWGKCEIRAKDFFAFWAKAKESGEVTTAFVRLYSGTFFSPSLPSSYSALQPFNPSTQVPTPDVEHVIGVSLEQFVAPYVVTRKGTSNSKSFDLARAIKSNNANISMKEITMIYEEWFTKSQPSLPKGATKDEYFRILMGQLKRVRFMESSLQAAIKRATSMKAPFLPALDGNEEATKLAALCRELQREAGDRPFICPVNVAQRFLNLRWPESANWLLHQLERNGVIECVERGAPNKPGQKGKSTFWRYKLPVES